MLALNVSRGGRKMSGDRGWTSAGVVQCTKWLDFAQSLKLELVVDCLSTHLVPYRALTDTKKDYSFTIDIVK